MARSRSGARLVAAAAAFLLPVLYSPSFAAPAWSPRAVVVLVVAAVGLPRLLLLLRTDARPAALAASAFLAVAALATALCAQPILSLFGLYNWGTGLLFVATLVGAWALGASLDEGGRALVQRALIAGICINAVVAVLQGALSLDVAPFTRYEGRAAGLLGNPVHLGTLCAAGLALLVAPVRSKPARWAPLLALVAAAIDLSGSRFALGLGALVVLVVVVRDRRRALAFAGAAAIGVLLGVAVGAVGGTTTGTGRVEGGSEGGVTARVQVWASAGPSIAAHPLFGVGPGRFRPATTQHRDLALVHAEGPDRYFVDAHNGAVEYATTTGLLGVVALGAWLLLAGRRAAGPLLGFAAVALAMHLVEPQFLGTTPLAFLALGAAGRADVVAVKKARLFAAVVGALVVAALGCGARLLVGDFELNQARLDFRLAPARTAIRLLPPWPEPATVAGEASLYRALTHAPAARAGAVRYRRLAADRDTTNPTSWNQLGETELAIGSPRSATLAFRRALHWDPWSVRALNGLGNAALAQGDRATARSAFRRSLVAAPAQAGLRRQLAGLSGP